MKNKVPRIVKTPVNNCVNPIRRPSDNWSISAMILLIMSPCPCESKYFKEQNEKIGFVLIKICVIKPIKNTSEEVFFVAGTDVTVAIENDEDSTAFRG